MDVSPTHHPARRASTPTPTSIHTAPEEGPPTLAFSAQPMPRFALVAPTPDGRWTAITRKFQPGESASCRLCPAGTCGAEEDVCTLQFEGVVREEDALLISSVGLLRVGDRGWARPDH
jgi:hypothetical protein